MSLEIVKVDFSVNFVNFVTKIIKKNIDKYKKIIFISPHKRPIRFIEKALSVNEILNTDFFTINEFVKFLNLKFSNKKLICHTNIERDLFFLELLKKNLPEFYKKLGNSDSKVFIWAKRLSKLFDEIDIQLLGNNLQNFQYVDILEPAKIILENLKKLYKIYNEKYINYGFNGIYFKNAVEIVKQDNFKLEYKNTLFIFGSAVYISNSEKKIIKSLNEIADIKYLIQCDLLNRDKYNFELFIAANKLINDLKSIVPEVHIKEYSKKETKNFSIKFFEFPDTHFEAEKIANLVSDLSKRISDIDKPENIGVVLPDSKTLFPFLNFLNAKKNPLNITLEYPFSSTEFGIFLENFLLLIIDFERKGKNIVDSKILLRMLNSNIPNIFKNKQMIEEIKTDIYNKNSAIYEIKNEDFLDLLNTFIQVKSFKQLYDAFIKLYNLLDLKKISKFTLQVIQLFYDNVIISLKNFKFKTNITPFFIYQFIKECINEIFIPFEGHPLKGIQILGMLEARLLNFKYIIIADANEGILPSGEKIDPLLPESIKREIGLTSFKEKEILMRYNFFRLIFSSTKEKCFIFYKTGVSSEDKNIRSRFIEQLILLKELNKEKIEIEKFNPIFPKIKRRENKIEKKYFKTNNLFSPTELDIYLTCPYKYYLTKIKKIEPRKSFESIYEADKVGSFIHKIFEEGFKPYLNCIIDKKKYLEIKKIIIEKVKFIDNDKIFSKFSEFQKDALKLLLKYWINNFFESKDDFKPFKLIAIEKEFISKKHQIYGKIDRIDELNNEIRIIDYKTGKTTAFPKKNKLNDIEIPQTYDNEGLEYVKSIIGSIQIPAYILMSKEKFPGKNIIGYIYEIGKDNPSKKSITDQFSKQFEEILSYIISHIKKSKYIYAIPSDSCRFCEYNYFCKFS